MAESGKSFQALLNGIVRLDYYKETEITDDLLKQEIYPDLPNAEFNSLLNKARNVIKSMAMSDMDQNQAETFLTSQTKKRDGGITDEQSKSFLKIWKSQKIRIHETLVQKCNWNSRLKALSWRIDVQSRSRNVEQVNAASAIVEMQLENGDDPCKEKEVLRFEIDDSGLSNLLKSLKDIEELINNHVKS